MTTIDRRAVRNQMFRLIEVGNDIYRNQEDSGFAQNGGEFLYCFDATVFNLFYNTYDWRHAVSSFHNKAWAVSGQPDAWKRVEAESALIAAEYLVSKNLPGQASGKIYLTPWHKRELAQSVAALVHEFKRRTSEHDLGEDIRAEVEEKLAVIEFRKGLTRSDQSRKKEEKQLASDLKELRPHFSSEVELHSYEATRRAASVLVRCKHSERLDQMHRIVSPPLKHQFCSLAARFRPGQRDLDPLKREAQSWFWRIKKEYATRRARSVAQLRGEDGERNNEGIWTDAQSIAFARWAAQQIGRPDQRLVFVTGDRVLFNAYSRWWVEQADSDEPFLLRNTFQYTPLFNLGDARTDEAKISTTKEEVRALFDRIREAVEIILLPFNLSRMGQEARPRDDQTIMRGREYLALRARDVGAGHHDLVLDHFMHAIDDKWYEAQWPALLEIAELWRSIERISVGFFQARIEQRLIDDRYLFSFSNGEGADRVDAESIVRYFSNSLHILTQRSRASWLPIALGFLDKAGPGRDAPLQRAPQTIWYKLPSGRTLYEFIAKWESSDTAQRKRDLKDLDDAPEGVFAVAAAHAIQQGEWWRAEEFAEQASVVCRADRRESVAEEISFILALTKRFRIGAFHQHLETSISADRKDAAQSSRNQVVRIYDEAVQLLNGLHLLSREGASAEEKQSRLRLHSERAALRLFIAASTGLAHRELKPANGECSPLELIGQADSDLAACVEMDAAWQGAPSEERRHVQLQFLQNCAASETLRYLLSSDRFSPKPEFAFVADVFETEPAFQEPDERVLQIERAVFRILHKRATPIEYLRLEDLLAPVRREELSLDRALADAIHRRREDLFDRSADTRLTPRLLH